MSPKWVRPSLISCPFVLTIAAFAAAASDEDLGSKAVAIYGTYCRDCHGGRSPKAPPFNLADRDVLVALPDEGPPLVVAGKPEDSLIWQKLGIEGQMPPKKKAQPGTEEKDLIRRWILAGAPKPAVVSGNLARDRNLLEDRDAMASMVKFLSDLPEEDRPHQRFFTLTIPYNRAFLARKSRETPSLTINRAALSKTINSLSQERDIVIPRAIDAEKTVYAVDLRELGWDKESTWNRILAAYPFGLEPKDKATFETWKELKRLAVEDQPFVRADWFIANATQPPLYFAILRLPEKVEDLEKSLGIDSLDNFRKAKVARAGFHESGISEQHRLIERHRTRQGAYWKSYDFRANNGERNLFQRPLGPTFEGNPHADQAFRHDGGEMIFSLPNGMQGYYLADGKGNRLEKAPIEIVSTPDPIESDTRIIAGISCIGCHKEGMKGVKGSRDSKVIKDELRERFAVGGDLRSEIERRHPRPDDFAALLERDRRRFLAALREATEPFLEGEWATSSEVVTLVAKDYFQKLDLDDMLIELGYSDRDLNPARIKARTILREQAQTDPLTPVISRRDWQSSNREFGRSLFQTVASQLELGVPTIFSLDAR